MKDFNYRFFLVFTFGLTLLFACSEKKEIKSTEDSFYSFVENTPSTFFSGKITLASLLTDLHYQDIPKLNTLLKTEVLTLSKGFDLKQPIYFTIDSLFQADGSPTGVYLFLPVKQKDSLCDKLSSLGFLVEPGTTSNFIVGNNLSGRIDATTAIIHLSKYASKKSIKTAYENTQKQVATSTKLTTESTALSMRLHLENMQRMLDAQYLDRLASKREELLSLYQNSFINCDFNFKNRGLVGEIAFDFSAALKKRLFFNENAPTTLSAISHADFVSGIGLSINPTKTDAFLADFYPNILSRLAENNLMMQFALMSLGKKPFSSITKGEIALAYHNQSMPTCYVSLGEQSNFIQKTITPYLSQSPIPNLSFNGNSLTNTTLKSASNSNKAGFYYTYQAKNDKTLRTIDHPFKFLDAIQTITFSLNNQGGTISIQGKKTTDGLLHQISMMYVKNIEALVAGM
jgi:hypothetical protein